ncbi:MAG: LytTR family transcriptional regulator DNA-binding domain-containing protein [Bacteroides sp.]|nr:LytTR family transcriptional regulator DNA-binding domain-containing protein [Bacteroides sp.]
MPLIKGKSLYLFSHIAYGVLVVLVLTVVFGRSWGNNIAAFYFISMLLPIVLGTSYFFNYYLAPRYLLKKKYLKFFLYTFYTAIVSVYLEMIVLMFSFIYLGNFNFSNLGPNASDTILLAVILYLLVFVGVLLIMLRQVRNNRLFIQQLLEEKSKIQDPFLEIMSNRKLARIPYQEISYIESFSDYIRVNTMKEQIISKEKISNLADRLPDSFIRIHRSFIINKEKIRSISYDEVTVEDVNLNIGRSYRKAVKEALKNDE